MLLVQIFIKKVLWFTILCFITLFSFSVLADQKSSFAKTLMDGVYIIDNAYWRSNDLLVFIEVSNTWSGADTYSTAELICKTLQNQGFSTITNYTIKSRQSKIEWMIQLRRADCPCFFVGEDE